MPRLLILVLASAGLGCAVDSRETSDTFDNPAGTADDDDDDDDDDDMGSTGAVTGDSGEDPGTTGEPQGSGSTSDTGTVDESDGDSSGGCRLLMFWADGDGDGFGDPDSPMEACEQPDGHVDNDLDCDDELETINPSVEEQCDGIDDDCDGIIDEYSASNPICDGCQLEVRETSVYWFCPGSINWFAARTFCMEHGAELTSIISLPEDSFIRDNVSEPGDWFIGLNDLENEGTYEWSDGTALGYDGWALGEPNNLDNENCGEMDSEESWAWNDTNCENTQNWICEATQRPRAE